MALVRKNKKKLSLRKKLTIRIFNKFINVQTQLHELTYLFWECTLRCNVNCLHCGSDCKHDNQIKDMPLQDFLDQTKKISKQFNPNKVMIVITGGEPLLRKDLEECGKELYKQGYPWGFVSNGFALTQERFNELMQSGLRSMTISLDGLEESHNWLRNNNKSFEKAVNAISIISKEKNFVYDIVTCVNQRNIKELSSIKELLISLGVKRWRIFTICPIGRAKDNPELNITNEQFVEVLDFIEKTRKEGKIKASYSCEGYVGGYENEIRDGFFFCRAGVNIGSILVDGSVSACPNINHGFIQGNIYKNDFLDIWNKQFLVMRDRKWMKTGICKDCKDYKWCNGNAIHLREPGNENTLRCHLNMIKEAN